jgi:transcriptional antiterminator RfaH
MTLPPPAAWYLVHTKARQERTAFENLQRQGYHVFLPFVRVRRRIRQRVVSRTEALFPRYLFILLAATRDDFAPVRSTIGVSALVHFGERYAQVPEEFVEYLQKAADEDGVCLRMTQEPHIGDRVVLLDGPLAGCAAVLTARRGSERVAVLLHIAGRHVQVEVSAASLGCADT